MAECHLHEIIASYRADATVSSILTSKIEIELGTLRVPVRPHISTSSYSHI